jgi:hypothetical protein
MLITQDTIAQMTTQFLEPNISITYDTTRFKPNKRDAFTFRVQGEQTEIKVSPGLPEKSPSIENKKTTNLSELEDYYKNTIDRLKKNPGSFSLSGNPVIEYDRKPQKIGQFRGFGFVEEGKNDKKRFAQIFAGHLSANDYTSIHLRGFEQKPLANQYPILNEFLKGFKSYSAAELSEHVTAIQKKYTVVVSKAETIPASLQQRAKEYIALVRTKEPMQDKIKEVYISVDGYAEVFSPNEKGEIYIATKSNKKGMIERTGRLIIISPIGKHISIPFSFQYEQQ